MNDVAASIATMMRGVAEDRIFELVESTVNVARAAFYVNGMREERKLNMERASGTHKQPGWLEPNLFFFEKKITG